MRSIPLTLALFLAASVCLGGEAAAEPRQQPQQQAQPGELLELARRNRASVHKQMLSYVKSSRALCNRIVLSHPESQEARDACLMLGELQELERVLQLDSDPMLAVQTAAAAKLWGQAEHYASMNTNASLRSAEFLYREIIRNHPATPQAVEAAQRLTQLSAALSVMAMWEQTERQAASNTQEGLRAAEHLCKEIIRLYPESPQAGEAARKLVEVSAALKNLPRREPGQETPQVQTGPPPSPSIGFSFDADNKKEWSLPGPDDLYYRPEKKTESLEPLPKSVGTPD